MRKSAHEWGTQFPHLSDDEAVAKMGHPMQQLHERYTWGVEKTFYIETFGCQMNAHDSEKVIGTLEHEGYMRVRDEADAGLILYNTCSIRDKAEQKVFHRLNEYKRLQGEGKQFAVLGCVAQQEGERIFERAPYVSIVSGSASYRRLPEMLVRLEAGERRITGLDDRETEETFDTEFTARTNPHRGLHHDYGGVRQVLRVLRGAVYAGEGKVARVCFGDGGGAADGGCGLPRSTRRTCRTPPQS